MRKRVNGTAVLLDDKAVLLIGPPGAGKSDLALRLVEAGARLIADDLVELTRDGARVMAGFPAEAPLELRGRIEARGLGIVAVPAAESPAELALVIQATPASALERLPETTFYQCLDAKIPILNLALLEASAPTKVRLALGARTGSIIPPS
jgi:serine kinase of HPr protein (carbohydrate metabolism regulator)